MSNSVGVLLARAGLEHFPGDLQRYAFVVLGEQPRGWLRGWRSPTQVALGECTLIPELSGVLQSYEDGRYFEGGVPFFGERRLVPLPELNQRQIALLDIQRRFLITHCRLLQATRSAAPLRTVSGGEVPEGVGDVAFLALKQEWMGKARSSTDAGSFGLVIGVVAVGAALMLLMR